MVYHGSTPYVTPHILHKHYAQAFDAEPTCTCQILFDVVADAHISCRQWSGAT